MSAAKKKPQLSLVESVGKWRPGGRGRPPKDAAERVARMQAAALEPSAAAGAALSSVPASPAPAPAPAAEPATAPPPPEPGASSVVLGIEELPDGAIKNPLGRAPAPGVASVLDAPAAGAPVAGPAIAPLPLAPWEDPAKIAALTVPCGLLSAFVLDRACSSMGREPVPPAAFVAAEVPKLTAQTVLCWYPEAGDLDPRWAITASLAAALFGLVQAQRPLPRTSARAAGADLSAASASSPAARASAAPAPAAEPPPAPAPAKPAPDLEIDPRDLPVIPSEGRIPVSKTRS